MPERQTFDFVVRGSPDDVRSRLADSGTVRALSAGRSGDFHLMVDAPFGARRPMIQGRLDDRRDGTTEVVGALIVPESSNEWVSLGLPASVAAFGWGLVGGGPAFVALGVGLAGFGLWGLWRRAPTPDLVVQQLRCALADAQTRADCGCESPA